MRRSAAAIALAACAMPVLAGGEPLVQREFAGRGNRFIAMPAGDAAAGFRAMAAGRRLAFGVSDIQVQMKGDALQAKRLGGSSALRYAFDGGAAVAPQGVDPSATLYHWLVGERAQWLTGLKSYGGIAYRGVWPGTDAVFAGDAQGFKYQFELAAGADPARVAWRVDGADDVQVNAAGALVWHVGGETVVDDAPVVYQPVGAARVPVASAYRIEPLGANSWRISFSLAAYDTSRPLVIDPAWIGYSGLVGGNADDQVLAVARDVPGNTYACGVTRSLDLPGASRLGSQGSDDAFVVKFNAQGTAQFVTYLGGSNNDSCNGIALDGAGNIYLAGGTASSNFPVAGSDGANRLRRTKGSDRDAFVTRLAPSGASVGYSGFIGGSEDDQANAIAVDSAGRAYVTGFSTCTATQAAGCVTASTAFPALTGPRLTHGGDALGTGGMDAFVARVAADGGTLEYAGFIGGDGGAEMGNAIAAGDDGTAYVAGSTDSASGLAAPGGFRTTANPRAVDAADGFAAKVLADGSGLGYFTLLTGSPPANGESGADRALAIALENDGSVVVGGETDSANFPASEANARVGTGPQVASGGGMDGFVLRLDAAGASIDLASYVGGSGYDFVSGVATDGLAFYLAGVTNPGTGFPTVAQGGLSATRRGGQDGFLASIARATPMAFAYAGFIGTPASDALYALAATEADGGTILSLGGVTTTSGTSGLTLPTTGASSASAAASNGLVLRIDPFGPPANVAVQAGTPQSAPINTAFATALQVKVLDGDGAPMRSVVVSFTAPTSGASASFTPSASVATDANGLASVTATANGTAGSYSVTAQAGTVSATFALTNSPGSQATLRVTASPPAIAYNGTAALVTDGGSGSGTVSYAVTAGTGFCTVAGSTLTGIGVGTCTVTATKAGDSSYGPASATVDVTVGLAQQAALNVTAPASIAVNGSATLSANGGSGGGGVSFSLVSGAANCALSGATLTGTAVGSCTVMATKAADTHYQQATAQATVNVGKADQTISFGALPDRVLGSGDFNAGASASSGLAVSLSSQSAGVCAVEPDQTVHLFTAGQCTLRAEQAGDSRYNPAPGVDQSFAVTLPAGTSTNLAGTVGSGGGTVTASVGGAGWVFAPQSAGFIPLQGHPQSPAVAPPAGVSFPVGLFDFVAINGTPGSSMTATLTYSQPLPAGTQYWKFGPTAANTTPHWYAFPGAVISGNTVTLTIVDGGLGDDDLRANGTVVEPGGPALVAAAVGAGATAIPTLSEWGRLLLLALLSLAAWHGLRRRQRA
ncbi:IPTL-CTERM sorting domain-containing protein [Xylophilus sp. GW821-FHT01B05]